MSFGFKIFLLTFATIITIFDILIFIKMRKVKFVKTGLKVFVVEDFFFLGMFAFEKLNININGKRVRKLEEIYDVSTAGQIARSASFAPISYMLILLPLLLCTLVITENKLVFFTMALTLAFIDFYFDIWLDEILKKRHASILKEFATVLSKMSLLVNAGITANEAFKRVANSRDGVLYDEMKRCIDEIENGRSISDALDDFSFRCGCKEVRKFSSLYKQNLIKGGPEFPFLLQNMADIAWDERKNRARLLGGAAEQKLLLPIMLMFVGVLIMIIVPAFNSLL